MPDVPPDPCCLVPRGAWDPITIYSQLDFVTHDNSSWVALADNIGTEPTFYSAVWMLVAARGDPGPSLNLCGPWQRNVIYEPLDVVSYQGSSWVARRDSIGRAPAENSFWMLLAERGSSGAGAQGPQGATGPAGPAGPQGNPGPQNLFVQQSNPGMTSPGVWFELRLDGTVKTIWVENGL